MIQIVKFKKANFEKIRDNGLWAYFHLNGKAPSLSTCKDCEDFMICDKKHNPAWCNENVKFEVETNIL